MDQLGSDIQAILADLAAAQQPRPPRFMPTALPHIWLGQRAGGGRAVLKRSRDAGEERAYRELVLPHSLPAPDLYHAAPDLSGAGHWLLLEPVDVSPPGLEPSSATHFWQHARRRDRAVVMVAALHARFWNRPAELADCPWLRRYEAADYWRCLEALQQPPPGWPVLGPGLLGQLASGAEMLAAGPQTLIHGSLHANNLAWRGEVPVLVDWQTVAWAPPFCDLGRLFTRVDRSASAPRLETPVAWQVPLLRIYQATIEASGISLDAAALAHDLRHAMLWELAVDLWLESRQADPARRPVYERSLHLATQLAADPPLRL
ncbi:MAG: aminoglycoside phosphotransferase family protein [Fimbriimonadaceae bacterium]|nr:aminoglycoside phosphotransferase family protein [Fimbriimonadaceae bacterium]